MYRIRFHGRGGQGMKTASRILGTSLFMEGFEVQDAPRYGAERRGAPVFAYVRASKHLINERGVIHNPDLIIIADESLIDITPETLFEGVTEKTVILTISEKSADKLQLPLNTKQRIIISCIKNRIENYHLYLSSICSAAAARLMGVIDLKSIEESIKEELPELVPAQVLSNLKIAESLFIDLEQYTRIVTESNDISTESIGVPGWIHLPQDSASISTPSIRKSGTSLLSQTGLWRTVRPVIRYELCSRCMLCNIYCPENVIETDLESYPLIDYKHCKGCLICAEVCPSKAIEKIDENLAVKEDLQ